MVGDVQDGAVGEIASISTTDIKYECLRNYYYFEEWKEIVEVFAWAGT